MPLNPAERAARLKKMLIQVAPNQKLENLGPQLEAMHLDDTEEEAIAASGLDVMLAGDVVDPEQADALEAIIHKKHRPAIHIVGDSFSPPSGIWAPLGKGEPLKRIQKTIPSIGRIEVPNDPRGRPYAGTGFVVGENLLMTNRHVAQIFATGLGRRQLAFIPGQTVEIDFQREIVPTPGGPVLLEIQEVVMVHPFWDMALLRVAGLPAKHGILSLSTADPASLIGEDVVVIGYPAQDERNPIPLQNEIFGGVFQIKRLQPGKLQARAEVQSFGRMVNAVTHDSSTLGGNSGSAVVHVNSGQIVALHFAGIYLEANYAVPMLDLASDPRVIDAGVKFEGSLAPSTIYPPIWKLVDNGESVAVLTREPSGPGAQSPPAQSPASDSTSGGGTVRPGVSTGEGSVAGASAGELKHTLGNPNDPNSVTFTIPFHVTVSLGTPVLASAATDQKVNVIGVAPGKEGLFGRRPPLLAETALASSFTIESLRKSQFHWTTALSCVLASKLSYESPESISTTTKTVFGFQTCEFIQTGATQCFVASTADLVLVAFRGTENFRDWMLNINVIPTDPQLGYGNIHSGFLSGFRSVKSKLESALAAFPGRSIVLTGHSLGGALATVAAAEWLGHFDIRSIYTYGQPCVGQSVFRDFMTQHYAQKFFRFVNDDDAVARVPPRYVHVGRLFHLKPNGELFDVVESIVESATAAVGLELSAEPAPFSEAQFEQVLEEVRDVEPTGSAADFVEHPDLSTAVAIQEGFLPSFRDHHLANYISKIQTHLD